MTSYLALNSANLWDSNYLELYNGMDQYGMKCMPIFFKYELKIAISDVFVSLFHHKFMHKGYRWNLNSEK